MRPSCRAAPWITGLVVLLCAGLQAQPLDAQARPPEPARPASPAAPPSAALPARPASPLRPPAPPVPETGVEGLGFGPWTVACDLFDTAEEDCVLPQRIGWVSDRLRPVELRAFPRPGGQAVLSLLVPPGAALRTAVRLESAAGTALSLPWQSCEFSTCEAAAWLPVAALQALEGQPLIGRYRPEVDGREVRFEVRLDGIGAGLAALRAARW